MNATKINGLVLSGGLSTRFGKDKGEIHYHNKSQRRYLYELLSPYCAAVYISCNEEQSEYINDLPKIEDTFLNIGPLDGILSAFKTNPNVAWLVVACDLPFLTDKEIIYLINHRNIFKMATAFWNEEGKHPEPMLAIWEPSIYPILLQLLGQSYLSPRKALIHANVELLHAPDASSLKNVNDVKEYKAVLRSLHEQKHS